MSFLTNFKSGDNNTVRLGTTRWGSRDLDIIISIDVQCTFVYTYMIIIWLGHTILYGAIPARVGQDDLKCKEDIRTVPKVWGYHCPNG